LINRFEFIEVQGEHPHLTFCRAVTDGLAETPKDIPTRFMYDQAGSELFEQITELGEYYPTRTERSLLQKRAGEIVETMGPNTAIVEFGSGSSVKTQLLIEAALARQATLRYVPIDISFDFLKFSSGRLLAKYQELRISAVGGEYFDVANALPSHDGPRLILFLGSNIGNLTQAGAVDFLSRLQRRLGAEDRLLVGIDLVKERHILEAAYNDALGITAAFNRNVLARINRELDGQFQLDAFEHHAPYDDKEARIEMRLYSRGKQTVAVQAIDRVYEFEDGEYIHTEWSHKFTVPSFTSVCALAGLSVDHVWTDERQWFGLAMLRSAVPS